MGSVSQNWMENLDLMVLLLIVMGRKNAGASAPYAKDFPLSAFNWSYKPKADRMATAEPSAAK